MEILSTNYNRRNPFVAGFIPILDMTYDEDAVDGQRPSKSTGSIKSANNLHIVIATRSQKSACSLKASISNISTTNQIPTTIYQIDVSKVCIPNIHTPKLKSSFGGSKQNSSKSKKTLRNKRQKEARRKRRNQRHVHFPEQDELIAIVFVIENDDFIKEYRNKYWEFFAIDRNRFEHRVRKISDILERVLLPAHRARIYKERFSCDGDQKVDSGCDTANNDSDQGVESKTSGQKTKFGGFNSEEINSESGFELDGSESESEENVDEISLSIELSNDLTMTGFHIYTPN